ncbi:Acetyltransferase (GNAT) family protein [Phyllobacterium sp. CL33Tsu]|uniref:GNAT family N-acetyltransferase n=1 Tax=Phyllobacterium sp. CL33Tsu TaxID=1798191 RepID=UPI0008E27875|nr:GNAT family N-acetyltransferase [Phyllobacterium sp. CL33Tsu]SFJ46848.1 Acetyltransferase (GNAT) family protein [Phyllobacterium sp. CL33Tsu]
MAPVSIRLAEASDVQLLHHAIVAMARGMGSEARVTSSPEDLARYGFGDKPAFETLIAEIGGAFAGMCLYFRSFSTWRGRPGIYVQDIYVEPAFRGSRVGERLLKAAAARARENGAAYLRLSVDTANLGAQNFYGRLGIEWSQAEHIHAIYGDAFVALAEHEIDEEGR